MRWVIRDHRSVFLSSIIVFFSDFLCACHILVQCRACVTLSLHYYALLGHLFLSACFLSLPSLSLSVSSSLLISPLSNDFLDLCAIAHSLRRGAGGCDDVYIHRLHMCACARCVLGFVLDCASCGVTACLVLLCVCVSVCVFVSGITREMAVNSPS